MLKSLHNFKLNLYRLGVDRYHSHDPSEENHISEMFKVPKPLNLIPTLVGLQIPSQVFSTIFEQM